MKLEKWFISNLDDSQRQIIVRDPNKDLIVQGSAGSGKTNLAIHRAVQASAFSESYAIVVNTIALKRMISYGLDTLGLDRERVNYYWAWINRGYDLIGDVYCRVRTDRPRSDSNYRLIRNEIVYTIDQYAIGSSSAEGSYTLKIDGKEVTERLHLNESCISASDIRHDKMYSLAKNVEITNKESSVVDGDVYYPLEIQEDEVFLVQDGLVRQFRRITSNNEDEIDSHSLVVGLDLGDYVRYEFYKAFGRRSYWFREVPLGNDVDITAAEMALIPSGLLYRKTEDKIDYLIIDEAQDFNVDCYKDVFLPKVNKSLSLFGDSSQMIYFGYKGGDNNGGGASMDDITAALRFNRLFLQYNYRLPKSIAKVAQVIPSPQTDLVTDNMKDGGKSDYPYYPKPIIEKFESDDAELNAILKRIRVEEMDDVAILVSSEVNVEKVYNFLRENGVETQVLYRTSKKPPFHTINTLDFTNNDLPCILTYHAAKGTEFDNVFIPFANDDIPESSRNAFYVACTRASHSLTISFSKKKVTHFLANVNHNDIDERNVPEDAWG